MLGLDCFCRKKCQRAFIDTKCIIIDPVKRSHLVLDPFAKWIPGATYHVYNRAVALNKMFVVKRDHELFREKLQRLKPYVEIYAIACVGTHFHMHVRIRTDAEIRRRLLALRKLLNVQKRYLEGRETFQRLIGDAFGRSFQAYARAFNLKYQRKGDLFNQTVRRLRVRDDLLSRRLCAYIHCQDIKHGLGERVSGLGMKTSFEEIWRGKSSFIDVESVLARFGGKEAFIEYHRIYSQRRRAVLKRFNEDRFFQYDQTNRDHSGKLPVWLLDRGEAYLNNLHR